ncbi:ABC transporter substrate-binding protein, partial [Caldanaerobius fijiensis]
MIKRKISLFIILILILSIMASGCQKTNTVNSSNTNKKNDVTSAGLNNKQKIFTELGWWPKPPLYQGNSFASGGIGYPTNFYIYDSLYQKVRSTDKLYPHMADGMPIHQGNKTIIKIRRGIKWSDGEPYTSKDAWAYLILNCGCTLDHYLLKAETPDDYTLVLTWNSPAPINHIKDLLIAGEGTGYGQVPYHLYKKWVDETYALLQKGKLATDITKRGPFGLDRVDNKEWSDALDKVWRDMLKYNPKLPVGTGPFKIQKVTGTDMILVKRPDYYNASNIYFEKVHLIQGTNIQNEYAMLKNGILDRDNGTPPKDILESILNSNKNLIHYMMIDPADQGFMYNLQKYPFNDVNFRRAITYVFDKTKIREVGNYYALDTVGYSAMGVPLCFMDQWVPQEIRDKMTKFTYDLQKAATLLKNIGWTKGSDGIWRDPNGKTYNFVIACNGNDPFFPNPAEVCAEQLTKFGLPTKLLAVDGSIYWANAQRPKNLYDMSCDWIDSTDVFMLPYYSLVKFFTWSPGSIANFPVYKSGPKAGQLNLVVKGPDGKAVDVQEVLIKMPYMSEDEMKKATGDLVWIANEDFAKIKVITIVVLAVVLAVVLILHVSNKRRKYDTRTIVYGGLSIAISFVLSYVRLYHMPQGGTITPASMLPLFVYAYIFGPTAGITAG